MSPHITYYTIMRQSKDPAYFRLTLVQYAQKNGNKPTAQTFSTTVKTVKKWRRRYELLGYKGLAEKSRAPIHHPHAVPKTVREEIIRRKRACPHFGAIRIKHIFSITVSEKTIRKIWRENNLIRRKRKKHKTKQDLRAVKASWRLFQQIDVDIKHLYDIPEYWTQMRTYSLPKYQYTARDVVSGLMFTGFADECSLQYTDLFADIVLTHLKASKANLDQSSIQTDNGSEFIGSWNARNDSAFTDTVQSSHHLIHSTIPPSAHTWQADVETVHRLIEDEFYEVESFSSKNHFFSKASTYQLWFNIARKNSYKNHKTPWNIIHERDPTVLPYITLLPALNLNALYKQKLKGGYNVVPYP
jgi:transposase